MLSALCPARVCYLLQRCLLLILLLAPLHFAAPVSAQTSQTQLLAISCGSGAASPYIADTDYTSGNAYSYGTGTAVNTSGVSNPAPQSVYQSERWGNSTYVLPGFTPGTTYSVRLHFAEMSVSSPNQRIFNVAINGTQVLTNFDIFAAAGGAHIAIVRAFPATADASGNITVAFINGSVNNAKISGIEVLTAAVLSPYNGSAVTIASTGTTSVEAENYDKGGEGVAYHDVNNGGQTAYRFDNIGVYSGSSNSNGYAVGWTAGGEWDGYTINVAKAGVFVPTAYVGSNSGGGTFHLEFGPVGQVGGAGVVTSAEFTSLNTYTSNPYCQPVSVAGISLPAGPLWMRVVMDNSPGNLDYFTLTAVPTLTSIAILPASASLNLNGMQQFTATAKDQNGNALSPQPAFTWSVASGGVGTVSSTGLYSSGTTTGSASVKATSGSISGTAGVTVTNAAPTVATAASATPASVTGTTTALSVLGADDGGESNLTYIWTTTGTPPAAVSFSANGTNAAKNVTATFAKAGTYGFQVTIKDAGGLTATSSVTVTVSQTLKIIAVLPASPTLNTGGTQQFTATANDQFGTVLTTQPTFTWSVTSGGVGTISTSGLYSAGPAVGNASIHATSGSISGSATVTVQATPVLTSITVSPATALLAISVSGMPQFTAIAKDQNGNPLSTQPAITWSIDSGGVGYINYQGYYASGSTVGSATVRATSGSISGTALVKVTSVPVLSGTISGVTAVLHLIGSPGAISYSVYRGTTSTSQILIATVAENGGSPYTVTDSGLANNIYSYTAVANFPSGITFSSNTITLTTVPAAPMLSVLAEDGQASLSWSTPISAVSYNLYRATTPGGEGTTPYQFGLSSSSFTDLGLTNTQTYYYQVSAVNPTGESLRSAEVGGTPLAASPPQLSEKTSNAQVALTWTAVPGAAGYNLYRATTSNREGTTPYQSNLGSLSYNDTAVINGTTYYYQVAATALNSRIDKSDEVSATPQVPPAAPSSLSARAGNQQIALSWPSSAGAATYNLYRSMAAGTEGTTPYKTNLATTAYPDTGLTNGTAYYYKVTAVGPTGSESGLSPEANAIPEPIAPAPTHLTATPGAAQVTLAWTQSAGAASYNIYRGTASGAETLKFSPTGTGPTFTDSTTIPGTLYYYYVTALNPAGESTPSNEASAQPGPPAVPQGLAAVSGNAQVLLLWSSVPGAATYNLRRSTASGNGYTIIRHGPGTRFLDTQVQNGTVYYYVVSAVAPGGESALSSPVSATPSGLATGLRVNSGGPVYTDSTGALWQADEGYFGGTSGSVSAAISNTNDPALYRTQRTGTSFSYTLPVANGGYMLNLLFAETQYTSTGQRVFSVTANGLPALTNFDIIQAAGAANKATIQSIPIGVGNGQLTLNFTGVISSALINAIQLTPLPSSPVSDNPAPPWAADSEPTEDGVNLASGVQEEDPGPDIDAYNPVGPSVSFERMYRSKQAAAGYGSPGLAPGWMHNYDITVQMTYTNAAAWPPLTVTYPNGSTEAWSPLRDGSGNATGRFSAPGHGAPYIVSGVPSSVAGQWQSLTVMFPDRSQNVFTPSSGNPNLYLLTKISEVAGPTVPSGRSVTVQYDASNRVQAIVNDAATTLLSFTYNGAYLASVQDASPAAAADQRQVSYNFASVNGTTQLTNVSQVAPLQTVGMPAWQYDYQAPGGLLSSVQSLDPTDPANTRMSGTVITYDANGRVHQHQDADGYQSVYSYNGGTAASGDSTQVATYDPSQVSAANPTGLTQQWSQNFTLGSSILDTGTTDANGYSDVTAYQDLGHPLLPTTLVNRNKQISSLTYDSSQPFGQLIQILDPRGTTATLGYDYSYSALGDLKSAQVSQGGKSLGAETYTYYPNGLLQAIVSPAPGSLGGSATVTTSFTYDALGNLLTVTGPGNNAASQTVTTYNYTSFDIVNGNPVTHIGDTVYSQPERLGEPVSVTVTGGPDTTSTYFEWDGRGRQMATLDALGNETDISYNNADQVDTVTYPPTNLATPAARAFTHYSYQYPGGPVTSVSLYPEGASVMSAPFRQATYTYGPAGELKSVADLKGTVATYTYDSLYRTTSVADGLGQKTYYQYDAVGNLSAVLYPRQNSATGFDITSYIYDPDGNLTQRFDGNNVETDYQYNDPASLLTAIHYPGGQLPDVTYAYDNFGRVIGTTDAAGSKTISYDDLDDPLTVTTNFLGGPQNQQIVYGYYADGSRQQMTTPLGKYGYQYDGIGRLTQTTFPWTGGFTSHSYAANGWLSRSQGPRTQTLYSYDGRGQLTTLRNFSLPDNTLLSSFTGMTYDAAGNRLGAKVGLPLVGKAPDGTRTLAYVYNARDEMIGETSTSAGNYGDNYAYTFGYDLAGNPTTSRTPGQSSAASFGFNLDNQFSDLTYDGNGNPTTYAGGSQFSFDVENRLTAISGMNFAATYDGDGLRSSKTGSAGQSFFLYDGDTPVVELGQSGSILAGNGYGADGWRSRYYPVGSPLAAPSHLDGQYLVYTFDPQGNLVQRQSQNNGQTRALDTAVYDGYGAKLGDIDALAGGPLAYQDPLGFGGQHGYYGDPETGMQLLTHRYYDSGRGRFVTRDPIGYNGGINLYGFVGNNPVNESDPDGTDPKIPTAHGGATSGAAIGRMDTNEISFTQRFYSEPLSGKPPTSGAKSFKTVTEMANGLRNDRSGQLVKQFDDDPVRLVKYQGKIFTLDNRRVVAFHQAKKAVPYRWATQDEVDALWPKHYDTPYGGVFIEPKPAKGQLIKGVLERFSKIGERVKGAGAALEIFNFADLYMNQYGYWQYGSGCWTENRFMAWLKVWHPEEYQYREDNWMKWHG